MSAFFLKHIQSEFTLVDLSEEMLKKKDRFVNFSISIIK